MKKAKLHSRFWSPSIRGLTASLIITLSSACNKQDEDQIIPATPVKVSSVQMENNYIVDRVFIGRVEASRSGELGFEVGGTLVELEVNVGDAVEAGDLLARLDNKRLEASLREAEAAVDEAKSLLTLSRATRDRTREAHLSDAVSAQVLDEAESEASMAEARLARLVAAVEVISIDLEKSVLRAPYAARIDARLADLGTALAPGQSVFKLTASEQMELRFSLPAAEADSLVIGQRLAFSSAEASGNGTLIRVRAARDQATRAVEAFLKMDEPDVAKFRPETVVTSRLPVEVTAVGCWLSRASLTEGTRGLWACYVAEPLDASFLQKGASHRLTRVDLEWLHEEGDRVFVRGPLHDGDAVVASGLQRLVPGLCVRLHHNLSNTFQP